MPTAPRRLALTTVLLAWNETLWSPPRAGTMMGVFRHVRDGEVVYHLEPEVFSYRRVRP